MLESSYLRRIRRVTGLTHHAIALAAGCTPSALYQVNAERRRIGKRLAAKLMTAFPDVPVLAGDYAEAA